MATRSPFVGVIAGLVAGGAVLGLMEATVRFIPESSPWNLTLWSALTSLAPVCPGFAAGLVTGRRGFTVGAISSVLTSILGSLYANFIAPRSVMDPSPAAIIPQEVTWAAAAIIVGGICGIAGAALRKEKPNAFP